MTKKENTKQLLPKIKEYDAAIENLFVRLLYSNPVLFSQCRHIVQPHHYHDREARKAIAFINEYIADHKDLPTTEQVKAIAKIDIEDTFIEDNDAAKGWFLTEYENFARYKELEYIITTKSTKLLQKNDYKSLLDLTKSAVEMGLVKNIGTDYFSDPLTRLTELKQNINITTGYDALDDKLYGGLERGTLNVICGRSGGGKSIALQNFAINYAKQGYNVAIISLELSENLYSLRMDSMITGMGTREVMRNSEGAAIQVLNFFRKHKGLIFVQRLPSGASSLDIRSYLQELYIQTGQKIDVLVVDYLDMCFPASKSMNIDGLWTKDKLVSEELRDLAIEQSLICLTASQLNRNSYEAVDLDSNHIAGGISKVNTADNVFAITTTPQMQKQGVFGFKLVKTRSSAGVGSDVDLCYDPLSMRIENKESSDSASSGGIDVSSIIGSKSKTKSQTKTIPSSMNPSDTQNQAKNLHDIMTKVNKR